MEGIGQPEVPGNLDYNVVDHWVKTWPKESFVMARDIIKKEGIFCGGSCGAALIGAFKFLKQ